MSTNLDSNLSRGTPAHVARSVIRRLVAALVAINLFVIGLAALWLDHNRQQDLTNARVNAENLALVLDKYLAGMVKNIDLTLATAADEYERQLAGKRVDIAAVDKLLNRQLARLPEFAGLRIADADGMVRHGAGTVPSIDVAERDYFIRARGHADPGLVISKPVLARIGQKWILVFARRLRHDDGSFAGIVYANLALERLTGTFATLNVGRRGAVTLRGGDLGVIARHPETQGAGSTVGNTKVSSEFRQLVDAGAAAGAFTVYAGLDNVERVAAFRKIDAYPLYVIVGLASDEVLADWRQETLVVAALVGLFVLVTLVMFWMAFGAWRRQLAAAAALAEQETKFRTIADFTHDWEYWQGPDQKRILHMSPSCERITGHAPAEFVADPELLRRIVHPDDRAAMADHLRGYAGHDEGAIDFRIVRRDGETRWIAHACRPVFGPDRAFLGRRVSNRDITDRKLADAALRRSEERLREAQKIAQLGGWELDLATLALTWSDETYRIFEIGPQGTPISYDRFLAAIHPEDRERVDMAYQTSVKHRLPYELTHRLLMKDGSLKYVHEHGETSYAADGKPLRSVGTVQDVTLAVLGEEALRESEERFRTIADYTYDWEYWQGPSKEFLYISPSCQRVTGYAQADFISNPDLVKEIVHPDDRRLMDGHIDDIRQEDTGAIDFRIVRPDGEIRWIAHGCRAVYAKDGRFIGRRTSNRDITERKNAEAEIQRLAYYDTLTGLPNRRMLLDRLDQALSQAKRHARSLAIMFLDLDHFKDINDTLGHDVGDALLCEVATRLNACVRVGDTVCRQGGDEFIIVLTEIAQADDAAVVAEKIVARIAEPMPIGKQTLHISTSVGIAVYPVNGDDDMQELLKKADKAMYAAKAAGRNGYRFFAPD